MKTTEEMIAVEQWDDIEGFEGRYQVSSFGNVRSLNFHRQHHCRLLKPYVTTCGYLAIILRVEGRKITLYVHRLVAKSFLSNPDNLPEIDHIDTDKKNNRIDNLRWVSHKENQNNPISREKMIRNNVKTGLGRIGRMHPRSKPVLQCDKSGNVIKEWESLNLAATTLGLSQGNIHCCCTGKGKHSCGGYVWKFKNN